MGTSGPIAGDQPGGETAVGEHGDEFHVQFARGVAHQFGDGLGDFQFFLQATGRGNSVMLASASSMMRAIMADGFDGIFSGGGLGGKHDGVGAIEDRVGDVGGFRAGGTRILGHGFEHLRGGDHRAASLPGAGDDHFLHDGHALGIHFHAEVAARDHDAVGDAQDGVQILDGFGFFELGDYRSVFSGAANQSLRQHDVLGMAHEADGDVVDILLERKGQVLRGLLA